MTTIVTNDAAGQPEEVLETPEAAEIKEEQVAAPAEPDTETVTEDEGEIEGESEIEEAQKLQKKSGFKRRIERYSAQVEAAKAEADYWRNLALQKQPPKETAVEVPKMADFDNVEDYIAARESYLLEQVIPQKVQAVQQQSSAQTEQQRIAESYTQKVKAVTAEISDYEEVVAELIDLPVDMQEFLLTSDVGPRVTYHLAANPEEAERLVRLPAYRRLAELGKLEDKIAAPKTPPTKKVTAAPPVAPKVKGDAQVKVATSTADAADFKTFRALRLKQMAERTR
jgi:hypothetical protein